MLPDNDQSLYGAPVGNNGMAVNPMFSEGAKFGNASPSMSYEDGGAIPDEEDDTGEDALNAPEPDDTTKAVADALRTVNSVLMYGRQKHGLPSDEGDGDMAFEDGGAVPSDSVDDSNENFEPNYIERGADSFNKQLGEWARAPRMREYEERHSPRGAPEGGADPVWDREAAPEGGAMREAAPEGGAIPEEDMSAVTAPTDDASLNKPQDMPPIPEPPKKQQQQSVLSYLMGTDAIDPQLGDRVMKMNGNDAARAIDYMVNNGDEHQGYGPGWAMAQYLRRKYDAYMNHGRAAVDNDDYDNAANSIMKAFENVPDGQKVQAQPTQDGIALTVADASGKPVATAHLNKEQLGQLTNTGKTGQFDAVQQKGVGPTIEGLAVTDNSGTQAAPEGMQVQAQQPMYSGSGGAGGGYGRYGRNPQTGEQFTEGNRPSTPSEIADMTRMRRSMGDKSNGNGADPGVLSFPGYKAYQQKYNGGRNTDGGPDTTPTDTGRPVRIFAGSEQPKTYINGVDQEPSDQEKKLELIRARGEGRSTAGDKRLEGIKAQEEGKDRRSKEITERKEKHDKAMADLREAGRNLSTERDRRNYDLKVSGERLKLKREGYKDEDIEKMLAAAGIGRSATPPAAAPQAPAPRVPQAAAPTVVQSPADAQKLAPGTVYMTPDGRKFTR